MADLEIDASLQALFDDLYSRVNSNEVYIPFSPTIQPSTQLLPDSAPSLPAQEEQQQERPRTSKSNRQSRDVGVTQEWQLNPSSDAPAVSWADDCYQYSVWNPANVGNVLMKLQVFKGSIPLHSSGVYLDEASETYKVLKTLMTRLENEWVNKDTGTAKVKGLTRIKSPLAAWRCKKMFKTVSRKRTASTRAVVARKRNRREKETPTQQQQ